MRRKFTLQPNEKYPFVVGSSDNFLIMRDLTGDVLLESDAFKNVLLSRSDTVVISTYQDIELRLVNSSSKPITGEIQLSEVDIRIKEQRMSLEGGVTVEAIREPVQVSEVFAPVSIAGVVPVSIQDGVSVEFPESTNLAVTVSNFPEVQKVHVENAPVETSRVRSLGDLLFSREETYTLQGNPSRKGLLIQASEENKNVMIVAGFMRLKAGGVVTLPACNDITIAGNARDLVHVGEIY